jgi:NADH:ubiquinone oxidoreductase subunit 6 (subunit J)
VNGYSYEALSAWASHNVETALFYLIAFIAIPLAYGVLFDGRIIRCGFLLIGVFGMISGMFLLLQAQFLAMAQLMIYAVGMSLVVVIALMLTNPRLEQDASPTITQHQLPAAFVAIAAFLTIYLSLRSEPWTSLRTAVDVRPGFDVEQIGLKLVGDYALPFEFASVLLLVALIGAVMLAKNDATNRAEEWIDNDADDSAAYLERKDDVVKV